ncbi:FecR domain-containing protein [Chitinophaga oryzae]|uniref:FecR domain-containing protein n=1 Tax=Chitinophaga oryzae TaxID=2725414 RepID=A0ABX6LA59_9BACT|nr:FecR family protein [Chitinophaga oryzae]QJB36910.1 FecR domain-containing protein [Chitinophaga oryzae]
MEAKEYYRFLLQRYYAGVAAPAEEAELFAELGKQADDEEWVAMLNELHAHTPADPHYHPAEYEPLLQRILQQEPAARVRRLSRVRRWVAAAAVIVLLTAAGGYWLLHTRQAAPAGPVVAAADVQPGKNGAVLTLANGQQVVLDNREDGLISSAQGTQVILKNGQVEYQPSGTGEAVANTLHTPRGRKFRMQLPDGTLVWLNAASALTFPTAFTGTERKVELTGEAYFEVAKGKTPFVVALSNQASVTVLGTHFNISSYADDPGISTTLLEGAVRVDIPEYPSVLKPGQQLLFNKQAGTVALNRQVDTAAVMAWKNGILNFQDKKLTAVIAMIGRWYDIEVTYAGTPPDITFVGEIGSDVNLSSVLNFLKESGVAFRLENRTLIIGKQ